MAGSFLLVFLKCLDCCLKGLDILRRVHLDIKFIINVFNGSDLLGGVINSPNCIAVQKLMGLLERVQVNVVYEVKLQEFCHDFPVVVTWNCHLEQAHVL